MIQHSPPALREQLAAVAIAVACALCFLGKAVLPTNAVLPYPPEVLEPARAVAVAAGVKEAEMFQGNLTMGDKFHQSLTWDRITRDRIRGGGIPMWTRDIGGGVPFVPQMGQVYHPANLLLFLIPAAGIYGIWYLLHMTVFGFFAYRFMRRLAIGHAPAIFGMITLILGFWTQARIHHNVMLSAALPLFAMLSCTHHLLICRGGLGHMAMLAAGTALSWISGFAPASLLCTYLVCSFAVVLAFEVPADRRIGALLRFGLAIALGLALASAQLIPVLLAAADTSRLPATIGDLQEKVLEGNHLASMIWPTLFAWPADHFYPGGRTHETWASLAFLDRQLLKAGFNFPETAFYFGVAPLCLAVGHLRHRRSLFFGTGALLGIAMAMGWLTSVSQFIPGAHAGDLKRFLLLVSVCTPVVAALGLQRVLEHGGRAPLVCAAVVAGTSGVLFFLHLSSPAAIQDVYGTLAEERLGLDPGTMVAWIKDYPGEPEVNRDALLRSFGIGCALATVTVIALLRARRFVGPVLCVLTAADLIVAGHGTIVAIPTERVTTPAPLVTPVLAAATPNGVRPRLHRLMPAADPDPLRIPVLPNQAGFWGIEDLAAYSPLPSRRMEEIFLALEPHRTGKIPVAAGGVGVSALRDPASLVHPLADLLGIEWVISRDKVTLDGLEDHTPADDTSGFRLYRRTTCLPRATFVTRAQIIPDRKVRLARLAVRTEDPRSVVVLEDPDAPLPVTPTAATAPATVEIVSHVDETVRITVRNGRSGYLRLADPFDPGWTATVDGVQTTVFVADHYLRAVFLAPGVHDVVFRYNGITVRGPQLLSLAALLGVLVLFGLGFRRRHDALAVSPRP